MQQGFKIVETPITFMDRRLGKSKMSRKIVLEAFTYVLRTRFSKQSASWSSLTPQSDISQLDTTRLSLQEAYKSRNFGAQLPFGATEESDPFQQQGRHYTLRVEVGKEQGNVYVVDKKSLSIGRICENDIFLDDPTISSLHASIVSMGDTNCVLIDEGSANGTKVNGRRLNRYQPYRLKEGEKIQVGQTVLIFSR